MLLEEKLWDWGLDEAERRAVNYTVYFINDRWDDYETFKTEDEADNFAEEMRAEGCEVRIKERAA